MALDPVVERALPPDGFVRRYVEDYAIKVSDAPEEAAVASALTVLGAVMLRRAHMPWGAGVLNPNLWTLAIGPSSFFRKSTAIEMPTELLSAVAPSRVGPNQMTVEGICARLKEHPVCMLTAPEFGVFLSMSKRSYNEGLRQLCMQLADGQRIDRQLAHERILVKKHWVGCIAASALPLLDAHTSEEDWMGGFMARFIPIHGYKRRSFPRPRTPPAGVRDELIEMLRDRFNRACPCAGFTPPAAVLFDRWYYRWEGLARRAGRMTQTVYSRMHAAIARVAMIYSFDMKPDRGPGWTIGPAAVRYAIGFGELVRSTLDVLERTVAVDDDMRNRNTVLVLVRDAGPAGIAWGRLITASHLLFHRVAEIVESLAQENMVTVEDRGGDGTGAGDRIVRLAAGGGTVGIRSRRRHLGVVVTPPGGAVGAE